MSGSEQGERQWASDDSYIEEVYDTVDFQLPMSGDWMRVQQRPPVQFAQMAEDYEMEDIREQVSNQDDDARMSEEDRESVTSILRFIRNEVLPYVVRPKNAHWANPPEDDEEVFDISSLHSNDLSELISKVSADDGEEQVNETGEYTGKFQREQGGHRTRDDGRKVRETSNRGRRDPSE